MSGPWAAYALVTDILVGVERAISGCRDEAMSPVPFSTSTVGHNADATTAEVSSRGILVRRRLRTTAHARNQRTTARLLVRFEKPEAPCPRRPKEPPKPYDRQDLLDAAMRGCTIPAST